MFGRQAFLRSINFLTLLWGLGVYSAFGAGFKPLAGHVPEISRTLVATGPLPATNELRLALGLALRDPAGLEQFLAEVYDPASPNYRHFLTPEELTARFGPTEQDYLAVKDFAQTNGLSIRAEHGNRLLLDVSGRAPAVQRAFHFHLQTFKHPTEAREFFAPDAEPTVDAGLRLEDVQGLSDYSRPRPKLKRMPVADNLAKNGSAPNGSGDYFGDDFRKAYAPDTTLTGAGQMVGLLQFDGFYAGDVAAYANAAGGGRANIPIQTVLLDNFNGVPTTGANSGNSEVALDIEMAMAMAPGLAKIVVFEAGPTGNPNDVLNAMLSSNQIKNLSCSWGWSGGPSTTTDNIFKLMAAAGQSFFNASGDTDAFVAGSNNDVDSASQQNAPSSSPYITQVGGTMLTTSGVNYSSETVWNDRTVNPNGGNWGSSGGVSTRYSIPSWQTNVSMAANGGSATKRNIPDVALTSRNVYSTFDNGGSGSTGGTSCAAPLWAGFMALVNQQAAAAGNPPAGFINPAVYALARTANYANCFHDVTSGDNSWSGSAGNFSAVAGYDLCTGLGTPAGQSLINALANGGDTLGVAPGIGFSVSGPVGGGFSASSGTFQLTNFSAAALDWSLVNTSAWLNAAFTSGTLPPNSAFSLTVSLTATASNLAVGTYSANLVFSNQTSQVAQSALFTLQVFNPLTVAPIKGFTAVGPVGGPFAPILQSFALTNLGGGPVNWGVINTSVWLSTSVAGGSLAAAGQATLTVNLSATAITRPAGIYAANVLFTNQNGVVATVPFTLSVGQPVLQNGGFELGSFNNWTLSGNTGSTQVTANNSAYTHSGSYGAQLGPVGSLGFLTQNLTTVPGQNYLLSLWLRNATGTTPNQFQVQWNGTTLFNQVNFTKTAWTNLHWLVTATASASVLQIGFRDDPAYLGLDDVTVTPIVPVAFKSTVQTANSFQLAWDTTAGLVYQVQYKTNLFQPDWIPLSTNTAGSSSLSVTDTNLSGPSRFYRLVVPQ